jgi:integrase
MRVNEVINLTWSFVDEKAGFIRLPASYVKEKTKRNVPISENLKVVLAELRQEQKRLMNISNRVFTRGGRPIKSIRTAFNRAGKNAQIDNLTLHDFRHTAITNWAAAGIPQPAIMAAAGHHSIQQNNAYMNLKDEHLRQAFKMATEWQQDQGLEPIGHVSY